MSGTYRMRREIGIPPPIAGEAQVRENPVSDQRGLGGILAVWRRSACAALHKAANMICVIWSGRQSERADASDSGNPRGTGRAPIAKDDCDATSVDISYIRTYNTRPRRPLTSWVTRQWDVDDLDGRDIS